MSRAGWITLIACVLLWTRVDARPGSDRIHVTVTAEPRAATPSHIEAVRALAAAKLDGAASDLHAATLDLAVVEPCPKAATNHVDVPVRLRLVVTDAHGKMVAVASASAIARGSVRAPIATLREQAIGEAMTGLVDQLRARTAVASR